MRANSTALIIFLSVALTAPGQGRYQPEKTPESPLQIPYQRYFTKDRFDRRITFYVTTPTLASSKRPLVAMILGSGCYSNFIRRGDSILDAHRALRGVLSERAYLLVVEKPGVKFLDDPPSRGTARFAAEEFRREHTLERWVEAVSAAMRAARTLPFIDTTRTLVIGHSEGGRVACRVAAENPFVSHVASLAAGGPIKLFDFLHSTRKGAIYGNISNDPEKQFQQLLADWAAILKDPDSTSKEFFGHPYRYWSSFLKSSPVQDLSRTNARVYIALGTAEGDVATAAFDVLYASLLAEGRDVTGDLVNGADHAFHFADDPKRDGWREQFEKCLAWFFSSAAGRE